MSRGGTRWEQGNSGIFKMRIHYGPGYGLYYVREGMAFSKSALLSVRPPPSPGLPCGEPFGVPAFAGMTIAGP